MPEHNFPAGRQERGCADDLCSTRQTRENMSKEGNSSMVDSWLLEKGSPQSQCQRLSH